MQMLHACVSAAFRSVPPFELTIVPCCFYPGFVVRLLGTLRSSLCVVDAARAYVKLGLLLFMQGPVLPIQRGVSISSRLLDS